MLLQLFALRRSSPCVCSTPHLAPQTLALQKCFPGWGVGFREHMLLELATQLSSQPSLWELAASYAAHAQCPSGARLANTILHHVAPSSDRLAHKLATMFSRYPKKHQIWHLHPSAVLTMLVHQLQVCKRCRSRVQSARHILAKAAQVWSSGAVVATSARFSAGWDVSIAAAQIVRQWRRCVA